MALWTPYAQDTALDLRKNVVITERASPLSAASAPQRPGILHMSEYYYASYTGTHQYEDYQYQSFIPCTVPTLSPESIESCPHTEPNASSRPELCFNRNDFFDTESLSEDMEYQVFERDALQAMAEKNGGTLLGNNPKMRRAVQTSQAADDSYRKQRERNNYAAKQSRDRRKLREVRLAFQVTYLKKKISDLKTRLGTGLCGRCGRGLAYK